MSFFRYFKNKNNLVRRIDYLEREIQQLKDRYYGALQDIKHLEEESIETDNVLYEVLENIRALDARIDILFGEQKPTYDNT